MSSMDIGPYYEFAKSKIGIDFNDINILITALTHRSYLNEHKKSVKEHNERLEFLGDAVLELIVTEHLYKKFDEPEGVLTNWRSALVRTESIGEASERLGVKDLVRLSRGEKRGTERAHAQILANAYEAIIGALYLDQGYDAAKNFIGDTLLITLEDILSSGSWVDPKSHLQEVIQSNESHTPHYKVLEEDGPDHDKIFTVGVFIDGNLRGKGQGPSKQAAQVAAAETALQALGQSRETYNANGR